MSPICHAFISVNQALLTKVEHAISVIDLFVSLLLGLTFCSTYLYVPVICQYHAVLSTIAE